MSTQVERLNSWDVSPSEAVALQKRLREQVIIRPLPGDIKLVAGADISFEKFSEEVYAAIIVLRLPGLEFVTASSVKTKATFPYIPGLLSFRETPPLLEA